MALAHSPKLATNGLVFAYDMGNTQKSWKGAPVTNLAVYTDYSNRNYDTLYDIGGFGGDDADVFYYRNGGYNNLPYKKMVKHTGGTGGSYINEHSYFTLVEGTTYIITCYMKSNAVTTVSGHTLALNRDSDNAYRVPADIALTTDWVKQSWTYTCAVGEGGTTYHFRQIVYNDTSLPVEVYWCGLQISVGTVSYPYVNGTRSNTQAIVDLMGTNTITATSLTYASNNTFSFNGSSNYMLPAPSTMPSGSSFSLNVWVKINVVSASSIVEFRNSSGGRTLNVHLPWSDNNVYFDSGGPSGSLSYDRLVYASSVSDRTGWHNWCFIKDILTGTMYIYLDGVLKQSSTGMNIIPGPTTDTSIGSYVNGISNYFNGDIPAMSIYNRALSAAEVQQNFNSLRGRYGV